MSPPPRSWTIKTRRMSLGRLTTQAKRQNLPPVPPYKRPATRADCQDGFRPCPFVGCKYHLFLDAQPDGGLKYNVAAGDGAAVATMAATCVLDVAAQGGLDFDALAGVMNTAHQTVRVEAAVALAKVRLGLGEG